MQLSRRRKETKDERKEGGRERGKGFEFPIWNIQN
jgi:hypothetical protein